VTARTPATCDLDAAADVAGFDLHDERVAAVVAGLNESQRHELARRIRAEAHRKALAARYPSPLALAKRLDPQIRITPALDVIDEALVDSVRGRSPRLIINMPPQEGKSTAVSFYGNLWHLLQLPDDRLVLMSYAQSLAASWAYRVRQAIDTFGLEAPPHGGTDLLGLAVAADYGARAEWELADHRGGMLAAGRAGGVTGRPADMLGIDDPYKDKAEADSDQVRTRVQEWWQYVGLYRLSRGAPVRIVHTRWREDDLTGWLIEQQEKEPPTDERFRWRVINLPALSGLKSRGRPIPDALNRDPGVWLESTRDRHLDDGAEYRRLWREGGARAFSAEFLGAPTPPEGGAFNDDHISAYRVTRDQVPTLVRIAVAIDPSDTGTADESGIIGGGRDARNHAYVLEDRSRPYTAAGWTRAALLLALDLDADEVVYEANRHPQADKAIREAWQLLHRDVSALTAAGDGVPAGEPDEDVIDRAAGALVAATSTADLVARLTVSPAADLVGRLMAPDESDPTTAAEVARVRDRLRDAWPRAAAIHRAGDVCPFRLVSVHASRGKITRAEPTSRRYEAGRVHHVGAFPVLEQQQTSWQPGQPSPDRMDALVWLVERLLAGVGRARTASPEGAPQIATRTAGRGRR
jgi:hypothetical protein